MMTIESQKLSAYGLFIAITGAYLLMLIYFPIAYIWAVYEDLVGEWAQWYCFLTAFIFSVMVAIKSTQYQFFFSFLSIACFYVVMEEISWGQRLLDYSSPGFFREHNLQSEANLHNFLVGPYDTLLRAVIEYLLATALTLYGLVYPVALRLKWKLALFINRWIPAPPFYLWPFFVTAALLELSPFYMLEQELAELLVGTALAVMAMYYLYSARDTGGRDNSRLTSRMGLLAIVVLSLSMATTYLVYSIPHMKVQMNERIHYGLSKFADRYQRYQAWGPIAKLYERGLEQKPRDISLLRDIATLYRKLGDQQKLKEYANQALAIDLPRFKRYPTWVSVNLSLAQTYQLIDDKVEVKRHLNNALIGARNKVRKNPDSANAAYWLGKTYDLRGEIQLAVREFKRAFDLDPDSSKYREAFYNSQLTLRNLE